MAKGLSDEEKDFNRTLRKNINNAKKKLLQEEEKLTRGKAWLKTLSQEENPTDKGWHIHLKDVRRTLNKNCNQEIVIFNAQKDLLIAQKEEIETKDYGYLKDPNKSDRNAYLKTLKIDSEIETIKKNIEKKRYECDNQFNF